MQCAIVFIQIRHSMMSHNKPIIGNCIDHSFTKKRVSQS